MLQIPLSPLLSLTTDGESADVDPQDSGTPSSVVGQALSTPGEVSGLPTPEMSQSEYADELKMLSDDELMALAQARFAGHEVPQSLALKVPNFMKQLTREAIEAAPKNTLVSAVGTVAGVVKDAVVGTSVGAASGVLSTATAVVDGLNWLDDAAGWDFIPNDGVERVRERTGAAQELMASWIPDSFIGQTGGSLSRFGIGLSAASGATGLIEKTSQGHNLLMGLKMLMSPRTASVVGGMAKGAFASTAAFSPDDGRFADLVQQFPQLRNPLTEYLASEGNEDDSIAEKRLKLVLDSVFGDILAEGAIRGISKAMKLFKKGGASAKSVAEATKLLDDADKALEKTAQSADNGISLNKGGTAADGQITGVVESGTGPGNGKRPRRGKGKVKYEDARLGAEQGVREADNGGHLGGSHGGGTAMGDGLVHQDGVPVTAPPVSDAGGTPVIDTDAALAEAQRLYANDIADSGTPPAFRPTHDITNVKHYSNELLQDDGAKRLLGLGNDTYANVLNRPASEVTTKPLAETAREARDILAAYADDVDMFKDLEKSADFASELAHKVVIARDAVAQGVAVLGGVLKKLDDVALDSLARKAIVDGELKTALRNYATLAAYLDRISTGTARALNAHKITAGIGKALTSEELPDILARMSKTLDDLGADGVLGLARRVTAAKDPLKAAKLLRYTGAKGAERIYGMVTEYWINSILSGVLTNTVNFTGNLLKAGILMPLDNMAMGWGGFKGGLFNINDREAWNQGVYAWWGMAESLRESWDMAVKSMKLGSNILKADNSFIETQFRRISAENAGVAADTVIGKLINRLGAVVNMPTRFLMASDELASQLAYRSNVRVHLMTKAKELFAKGMGADIGEKAFVSKYIADNFDAFFSDAVSGSGAVVKGGTGAFKQGLNAAMEATYTAPLAKGSLGATIQRAAQKHPLVQHIVPFVRTPTNILDDALQRMPGLNLLSKNFRDAYHAGGEAWARAQAKLTVGTAFCGVATAAYMSGSITGSGPKDKATRDALMATGWRPNSVKAGDKYISYARLEPFATVLGAIADAGSIITASTNGDANGDTSMVDKAWEAATAVTFGVAQNLSSKSYMSGLSNLMSAIESGNSVQIEKFFANYAASYVPSLASGAAKVTDPTMKEVRGVVDAIMNRIPGLSDNLPAKHSWLTGQPIQYMGGMASAFSPVVWESEKNDPTLNELIKVADGLSAPSNRISGIKLDAQQLSDYHRLHGTVKLGGKTLMEALEVVVKRKERLMPVVNGDEEDKGRNNLMLQHFNSIIKLYRKQAQLELRKLHPELEKAINAAKNKNKFYIAPDRNTAGSQPITPPAPTASIMDVLSKF